MASPDCDSPWLSSNADTFARSFNMRIEEGEPADSFQLLEVSNTRLHHHSIPKPPPFPGKLRSRHVESRLPECCCVPKETKDLWDQIFQQGHGADVYIVTEGEVIIPAHFSVLSVASPVLGNLLQEAKHKNGAPYLKILGVPQEAVRSFICFLYSSCYEEGEMEKFVLHLLALSHSYMVPSLKRVCIYILEQGWLTTENVIDVLQLARLCDAPRISCICLRMIIRDFRNISSTEGWKIMRRASPALEQELLEMIVEADTRKQEKVKKIEERKVYLQLHEAMEALLHICRDGCRTIGPRDKVLKGSQVPCSFPACKGIETLVRHFSGCKARVPGGCMQCKRMWQLLELHSRMCNDPDYCKVPLCRQFQEKMRQQNKKDETRWKLLVSKVLAAKYSLGPFASPRSRVSDHLDAC